MEDRDGAGRFHVLFEEVCNAHEAGDLQRVPEALFVGHVAQDHARGLAGPCVERRSRRSEIDAGRAMVRVDLDHDRPTRIGVVVLGEAGRGPGDLDPAEEASCGQGGQGGQEDEVSDDPVSALLGPDVTASR